MTLAEPGVGAVDQFQAPEPVRAQELPDGALVQAVESMAPPVPVWSTTDPPELVRCQVAPVSPE